MFRGLQCRRREACFQPFLDEKHANLLTLLFTEEGYIVQSYPLSTDIVTLAQRGPDVLFFNGEREAQKFGCFFLHQIRATTQC